MNASQVENASGSPACLTIFAVHNPPSQKSKPSTSFWINASMPCRHQQPTLTQRLKTELRSCNLQRKTLHKQQQVNYSDCKMNFQRVCAFYEPAAVSEPAATFKSAAANAAVPGSTAIPSPKTTFFELSLACTIDQSAAAAFSTATTTSTSTSLSSIDESGESDERHESSRSSVQDPGLQSGTYT